MTTNETKNPTYSLSKEEATEFVKSNREKGNIVYIKDMDKTLASIGSKASSSYRDILKDIKNGVDKFANEDTDFHLFPKKPNLNGFEKQNVLNGAGFDALNDMLQGVEHAAHGEVKNQNPLYKIMKLPKDQRGQALKDTFKNFKDNIKILNDKNYNYENFTKGFDSIHDRYQAFFREINESGSIDNYINNALSSDKDKDMDKKGGEQKDLPKTKDHRLLQKTHKDVQHEAKPLMSGKANSKSEPKQNLNLNNR